MRFRTLSMAVIVAGALIAQAATSPSKPGAESSEAKKLLTAIKADAEQIRSSARNLERLTRTPDAKWSDYDRQWNMIKPAEERIDLATRRLERIQPSLPAPEQLVLAQTKRDAEEITSATHDLWTRLGQPKVDLKTQALNADAHGLDKAARELIKETASTH